MAPKVDPNRAAAEAILAERFMLDGDGKARVCAIQLNASPMIQMTGMDAEVPNASEIIARARAARDVYIGQGSQCDAMFDARNQMEIVLANLKFQQEKFTRLMMGLPRTGGGGACEFRRSSSSSGGILRNLNYSHQFLNGDSCAKAARAVDALETAETEIKAELEQIARGFRPSSMTLSDDNGLELVELYISTRVRVMENLEITKQDFEDAIDYTIKDMGADFAQLMSLDRRNDYASAFVNALLEAAVKVQTIPDGEVEKITDEAIANLGQDKVASWPKPVKYLRTLQEMVRIYDSRTTE